MTAALNADNVARGDKTEGVALDGVDRHVVGVDIARCVVMKPLVYFETDVFHLCNDRLVGSDRTLTGVAYPRADIEEVYLYALCVCRRNKLLIAVYDLFGRRSAVKVVLEVRAVGVNDVVYAYLDKDFLDARKVKCVHVETSQKSIALKGTVGSYAICKKLVALDACADDCDLTNTLAAEFGLEQRRDIVRDRRVTDYHCTVSFGIRSLDLKAVKQRSDVIVTDIGILLGELAERTVRPLVVRHLIAGPAVGNAARKTCVTHLAGVLNVSRENEVSAGADRRLQGEPVGPYIAALGYRKGGAAVNGNVHDGTAVYRGGIA